MWTNVATKAVHAISHTPLGSLPGISSGHPDVAGQALDARKPSLDVFVVAQIKPALVRHMRVGVQTYVGDSGLSTNEIVVVLQMLIHDGKRFVSARLLGFIFGLPLLGHAQVFANVAC